MIFKFTLGSHFTFNIGKQRGGGYPFLSCHFLDAGSRYQHIFIMVQRTVYKTAECGICVDFLPILISKADRILMLSQTIG